MEHREEETAACRYISHRTISDSPSAQAECCSNWVREDCACLGFDIERASRLVEVLAGGGDPLEQGAPADEVKPKPIATAPRDILDAEDDVNAPLFL